MSYGSWSFAVAQEWTCAPNLEGLMTRKEYLARKWARQKKRKAKAKQAGAFAQGIAAMEQQGRPRNGSGKRRASSGRIPVGGGRRLGMVWDASSKTSTWVGGRAITNTPR